MTRRVLLLTTSYPRFESDVAGNFVREMARALVTCGARVTVLLPWDSQLSDERDQGIELRPIRYELSDEAHCSFYRAGVPDNAREMRTWFGLFAFSMRLFHEARRHVSTHDLVIAHFGVPCGVAASMLSIPSVVVWHSADVHLVKSVPKAVRTFLLQKMRDSVHWFVRENPFAPGTPSRFLVRPMGIAGMLLPSRAEARARLGIASKAFVVLSLGRLVPIKAIDRLLDALREDPEAVLLIAGDGPERARLAVHFQEMGDRVRWFGVVAGERKAELFAAANVFVLPSRHMRSGRSEGAPLTLLEAGLARLPVVVGNDAQWADPKEVHFSDFSPGSSFGWRILQASEPLHQRALASSWSAQTQFLQDLLSDCVPTEGASPRA